ncbi:hypothetical protein [Sporomusa malonica]|uniref:Methionine synthase II (Cobalamin-independent) n=1 Tax=Sporomusa malonica TaxID=112901 RepID=A0A1W2E5I4_9FIRM|nr:hypothetical protein [Sporomusa malonica]SMD04727.1 hypothetical protein SAMN04488500_12085 [Sporomusa malonica]
MNWLKPNRATGLGSLPHQDELMALKIIAKTMPHWPHWPQLPGKMPEQGFVVQYVQPLIKLGVLTVTPPKDPVFARLDSGWADTVVEFYEQYMAFMNGDAGAEQMFALDGAAFAGLEVFTAHFSQYFPHAEGVKGHISGPLTVGLQIKDERGRACFYEETLRDILVKCLAVQAVLEARRLKTLGLPVLIFIDDPSLFLIGASTHITLTKEAASAALAEIIELLHQEGAKVGVHACAGIDWSILFELPVDVISFDAYHYFTGMALQAKGLAGYLEQGGKLAWGLIPTSGEAWQETPESILTRFDEQSAELAKRGLNPAVLRQSIIWTPSCGTGALPVDLAAHIYSLVAGVVARLDSR